MNTYSIWRKLISKLNLHVSHKNNKKKASLGQIDCVTCSEKVSLPFNEVCKQLRVLNNYWERAFCFLSSILLDSNPLQAFVERCCQDKKTANNKLCSLWKERNTSLIEIIFVQVLLIYWWRLVGWIDWGHTCHLSGLYHPLHSPFFSPFLPHLF